MEEDSLIERNSEEVEYKSNRKTSAMILGILEISIVIPNQAITAMVILSLYDDDCEEPIRL